MCGRFVSAMDADGLVRFFTVDDRKDDDVPPSWNVAPTDPVRAVVEHGDQRLLVRFRWGLVPAWAGDRKMAARMINARAESVAEKPAFREAFVRRRCLIPADGFYEWRTSGDGRKIPHFIHDPSGDPLAFAGLWAVWRDPRDPAAEPLHTCTIITTAAAPSVAQLHDRMPVALDRDRWDDWLDREHRDAGALQHLLTSTEATLTFHPVSEDVNRPLHNHPDLIQAV